MDFIDGVGILDFVEEYDLFCRFDVGVIVDVIFVGYFLVVVLVSEVELCRIFDDGVGVR